MNFILYVSSALENVIPDRLLIGDGDNVILSMCAVVEDDKFEFDNDGGINTREKDMRMNQKKIPQ
jgi:hypothetical protein